MLLSLADNALLLGLLALFISPIGPYRAYKVHRLLGPISLIYWANWAL